MAHRTNQVAEGATNVDELAKLSDKALEAHIDDLATKRTEIRLAQVAAAAERDLRRALSGMSAESRRIVEVRLSGDVAPTGEAASEGKE